MRHRPSRCIFQADEHSTRFHVIESLPLPAEHLLVVADSTGVGQQVALGRLGVEGYAVHSLPRCTAASVTQEF
jgi:hypothetical protein